MPNLLYRYNLARRGQKTFAQLFGCEYLTSAAERLLFKG